MKKQNEKRFNLVDEAWIPVSGQGLVSLDRVFTDNHLKDLGGNPIEKITLTKFLLAIAQAAYTPENTQEWKFIGAIGMAEKTSHYLHEKKDLFWLYGDKPFLQMPAITKAETKPFSVVLPDVATGNTTVLLNSQIERELSDAEKSLILIFLSSFALGGKKTDNSIVLTSGYTGKINAKGRPSTSKPGPSLGFMGYLHSFLCGASIFETVWLNLFTKDRVHEMIHFPGGIGTPPWEQMPTGEDCENAKALKQTLIGRLVPLCRFVLLAPNGLHYSEGLAHPDYKNGGIDPTIAVNFSNIPRVIWADPEKRPWRQLPALLSFLSAEGTHFDCAQLRSCILRARKTVPEFRIWSGGLSVSSNAGEQYVSGSDDFVESEILLKSDWLGEIWFNNLKAELEILEEIAKSLYGAVFRYYKSQKANGKGQAAQATNLYWQLSERQLQSLINACGEETGEKIPVIRLRFVNYANKAFNTFCPRDTARQIEAWAANRPNFRSF